MAAEVECIAAPEVETILVSRERLTIALQTLVERLPDMLAGQSDSMPMGMRLAVPALRMFLTSKEIEKSLTGESLVGFVWEALQTCQSHDE